MHLIPLIGALCAILLASSGFAEEKTAAKPMDPEAMMEAYEKLAAPGEAHR